MAALIAPLHAPVIRERLALARERIAAAAARAGRDPDAVELLVATKYVALEDLPVLAQAGVTLVGENRAQDLEAKAKAHGELFTWDFIGQLQSRKVRAIVPHVRLIHSVASLSALRELERHREAAKADLKVLIEVNVAGERGKAGIAVGELDLYLERCPVPVAGRMSMPPATDDPDPGALAGRGGGPVAQPPPPPRPGPEPPLVRRAARAGARPRSAGALDGHKPGLRGGGAGGREHRATWHERTWLAFAGKFAVWANIAP
jgi:uncharacterized pyridoxal phosphate-containing UPF0001 family protein